MLVNLNRELSDSVKREFEKKHSKILDFTGIFDNVIEGLELIQAREIDFDHSIERQSIESYVNAVSELSSTYIRDVCVEGIPIWWLTAISEKHDSQHWGQIVFFFLEFFKSKNELFDVRIELILPKNVDKELERFILDNTLEYKSFNITFNKIKYKKVKFIFVLNVFLKAFFKYFLFKIKKIRNTTKLNSSDAFILVPFKDYLIHGGSTSELNWFKDYLESTNSKIEIDYLPIPSIHSLSKLDTENLKNEGLKTFLTYSPSITQILIIFCKVLLKSIFLNIKSDVFTSLHIFNKELIKNEFYSAFANPNYFLTYLWISSFSKRNKNKIYIFSDEFYTTGRLLSCSIYSSNENKTYGVQHGLITKNHTVYRYTEEDFKGNNSLPKPDRFFMWNNMFKKIVSQGIIPYERIIQSVSDYPSKKIVELISILTEGERIAPTVLWATTLWSHFTQEYKMLESIFEESGIEIVIRLHPKNHISMEQVDGFLNEKKYKFSVNSYEKDLAIADILITNTFSTVYYDCYKSNINCIRIEHNGSFCDLDFDKSTIFNVRNKVEFKTAYATLKKKISNKV